MAKNYTNTNAMMHEWYRAGRGGRWVKARESRCVTATTITTPQDTEGWGLGTQYVFLSFLSFYLPTIICFTAINYTTGIQTTCLTSFGP